MTHQNSSRTTLSFVLAGMLAIFAGLSATPTSAEACGDYSSFQTDEELVESAIRTHVYYTGLDTHRNTFFAANWDSDSRVKHMNNFVADSVRVRGERATAILRRVSDGRLQRVTLKLIGRTWEVVNVRNRGRKQLAGRRA
ncbi:MAG: hypothetical protein JKY56_01355 [Kofleriaceae bacterium]|nr:hypothetical protein [Kofleriaceae bacterium]